MPRTSMIAGLALALLLPATATAQTPMRSGLVAVHQVGGCPVFPADHAWNTRVDGKPLARRSTRIIQRQASGHRLHLDLGTTEEYWGIPVNVVPADQPLLPLSFGVDGEDYRDESDTGPVPVPADAKIEGGSAANPDPTAGDRHLLVVQQGSCELIEMYHATRQRDAGGTVIGWRASAVARWSLRSPVARPAGWTSADAAGLPIMPGLLSYPEAASGEITHALRFTLPRARNAYTWPARHCGPYAGTGYPAYGMRFRLKRSFGVGNYTGAARAMVVAMKRYGLIFADQGSAMFVTGTSDPRWEPVLEQFRAHPIDGSKFEVVRPGRVHVCG